MKLKAQMWHIQFKEYEFEEVFNALVKHASSEKFAPSIAELKLLVAKNRNPEAFETGEKAWEIVDYAVRKFGSYNQDKAFATFSEPIKRAVRNVGGWQKICQTELGQSWEFLRKNFISTYNEFTAEGREQVLMPESVLHRLQEIRQKRLEAK